MALRRWGALLSVVGLGLLLVSGGGHGRPGGGNVASAAPQAVPPAVQSLRRLAAAIRGPDGKELRPRIRRRMLVIVAFASGSARKKEACTALRATDFLRRPIADKTSYTKRKRPKAAARLDARVVAADRAIIRSGGTKECAMVGSRTAPVSLEPVTGSVKPKEEPVEHEQGDEVEELEVDPKAPRFTTPGEPVTVKEGEAVARGDATARPASPNDPVRIYARADAGAAGPAAPHDMQVASAGGVVLISGNGGAFYSIDGGAFASLSAPTVFGSAEGGFCCDTVLRYAPQIDRFLWLLQGDCVPQQPRCAQNQVNRYVLAVTSPAAIRSAVAAGQPVEGAWSTAQLTQALLRESTTWWDYPHMAVGDTQLYLTWNRVRLGMMFLRINLQELASGSFRIYFFNLGGGIFGRLAQQSGPLGVLVRNQSSSASEADVLWIHETSGILFDASLPHTAVPTRDYTSPTPEGGNWTGRVSGGAVKAATVRRNELWVAWGAGRGYPDQADDVFPQPHIQYAAAQLNTGSLFGPPAATFGVLGWRTITEGNLANPDYAMLDPAFATNAEADVGISFSYGGPDDEPSPAAGIITGRGIELYRILGGERTQPFDNIQGDYSAIQPDSPDSVRFVSAGVLVRNDPPGPRAHYVFMRFGRSATSHRAP